MRGNWALAAFAAALGSATPALACTPVAIVRSAAEEIAYERSLAAEAASPTLANRIREAADISIVRVAGVDPGVAADIPARYREHAGWYAKVGLMPVHYRVAVERRLKGQAPDVFAYRRNDPPDDKSGFWMVAASENAYDFSQARRGQSFWQDGYLGLGQSEGGPGDCSFQGSLDVHARYLVFRDADGLVTAADLLVDGDSLAELVARAVADPTVNYLWQPTVEQFLRLDGALARVRVTDCVVGSVMVIETLRSSTGDSASPKLGEALDRTYAIPALRISSCREGGQFLITGWPFSARLHPIEGGVVTFEDRWMQIRFSGDRTVPLETVRELVG